jgi:hypothetical protein
VQADLVENISQERDAGPDEDDRVGENEGDGQQCEIELSDIPPDRVKRCFTTSILILTVAAAPCG